MRAPPLLIASVLLSVGCTTVQDTFTDQLSASGISMVSASLDSGTLSYRGVATEDFTIDGRSWGMASQAERASERLSGNTYAYGLDSGALVLQSHSDTGLAGVDFNVTGPMAMNTAIDAADGSVELSGLSGFQHVSARRVDVEGIYGGADLLATSGSLDAEIYPGPGDSIRIETYSGDVELTLPWGGGYDIQVWGDPEYAMEIEDLGFYSAASAPAYFAGVSGSASIRVDVFVTGGSVRIDSAW